MDLAVRAHDGVGGGELLLVVGVVQRIDLGAAVAMGIVDLPIVIAMPGALQAGRKADRGVLAVLTDHAGLAAVEIFAEREDIAHVA